jgi:hypothetical protein
MASSLHGRSGMLDARVPDVAALIRATLADTVPENALTMLLSYTAAGYNNAKPTRELIVGDR